MNSQDPFCDLNPPELWKHFAALNGIPRRPGNEAAAREYIERVAVSSGAEFTTDSYGNCVVRTAGRPDQAGPPVAIQAHLDMVCESAPDSTHNFDNDPIVPIRDGDKVAAQQTTLGADNGIGVAAALALLTKPMASTGPLELIFTVEEEIGLLGALNFDVSLLRSRHLINLDSEEDNALTVGCAGEQDLTFTFELPHKALDLDRSCIMLSISGLSGGHSGVQIHERRANAIKLLAKLLERAGKDISYCLVSFAGGSAHNAIPREASAVLAVPTDLLSDATEVLYAVADELTEEWLSDELAIRISIENASSTDYVIERDASDRFLAFLSEVPHGVISMSEQFSNTVETSANLATVQHKGGPAQITISIRGLVDVAVDRIASQVKLSAESTGADLLSETGYPGWEPKSESFLVKKAVSSYTQVYGKSPRLDVVHGGLECGVLVARQPGLEAVSFGPRIREAHTPREHVYASTVDRTWRVLHTLSSRSNGGAARHLVVKLLGLHVPKDSTAELFGCYAKGAGELDDGAQPRLPASTLQQGNLGAVQIAAQAQLFLSNFGLPSSLNQLDGKSFARPRDPDLPPIAKDIQQTGGRRG